VSITDRNLAQELSGFALRSLGVDLFGVAPVERLAGGPEGGRPTDYLPDARAVVVLALRIPGGALRVAGRYDEPGKSLGPYMWYGYTVLNWDLSSAAAQVARFLETRGFEALPFPPTGFMYRFGNRADFSHRHAAVAAGLGELGYSSLLLTPQFGPGQRIVSIVTDAPLEPSPMYDGPSLCRPHLCRRACVTACPTKAMTGEVSCTIGGKTFRYATVHSVKCRWPFAEKGFRRTKVAMPDDPTEADYRRAVATTQPHPIDADLSAYGYVPPCGACLFRCPSPHFD
jgi:epoxyqueuosine reductase